MGRYETIETVIRMQKVYSEEKAKEMREKYFDETLSQTRGGKGHRRIVENACVIAEIAQVADIPEELKENALIFFGVCVDSEKHRLNWKKCRDDLDIQKIVEQHNKYAAEKALRIRRLLEWAKELVTDEEWNDILSRYRIRKNWKAAVSENWHRVIVGSASKLANAVVEKGGTAAEVKLAVTYFRVCMDANKHLLDYTKFEQENGVVELYEKYLPERKLRKKN